MGTIISRLNELITRSFGQDHGRVRRFAAFTGVNENTLSTWLRRGVERPDPKLIAKIARATGVTTDWILSGQDEFENNVEQKESLVGLYIQRGMEEFDPATRKIVDEKIERIERQQRRRIPVLTCAQAGAKDFWLEGYKVGTGMYYINAPPDLHDPHAYVLIVEGDSMVPKYSDGDLVVASPNTPPTSGSPAVVKVKKSGEVMVRIWHEQPGGSILLESVNQAFKKLFLKKKDLEWRHRILWTRER